MMINKILTHLVSRLNTWHEECTAVAISHRHIRQTFQFTICFCVNLKEFQLTFTIKVTLSPGGHTKKFNHLTFYLLPNTYAFGS
jgi:hypothetical protein